jgi:predicted 3-demethylubiquinone-9 3-methyltransferase (glyoxalase superfamily)
MKAEEAAQFYVSIFPDSKILSKTMLYETPSGTVDVMTFKLLNQEFQAIGAGPEFKLNPSIVSCHLQKPSMKRSDSEKAFSRRVGSHGFGAYPFSERYGWLQDRYGFWQIIPVEWR